MQTTNGTRLKNLIALVLMRPSVIDEQRQRVAKRWEKVRLLEKAPNYREDPNWQDAVTDALFEKDWLDVHLTDQLHYEAQRLDVDLPKCAVGEHYKEFMHFDSEQYPDPPLFLTDVGFKLVKDRIRAEKDRRYARFVSTASIVSGLGGLLVAVLALGGSGNSAPPNNIEVVLRQVEPSTTLPPAIWRNPATFDPVEHFFLFPAASSPEQKWTGEVRAPR